MQWLYRLIRQKTRPIPRYKARIYHDRLSLAYYMFAWTAGGIAFMQLITHEPPVLPDDLNVHSDPAHKVNNIYSYINRINRPDEVTQMKVVTLQNFAFKSSEEVDIKDLKKKTSNTQFREKMDFYGNEEHGEEEAQDVNM